ncbi:MAG TPA: hypothetical protein VFR58_12750 [Flavisolibacter sp.]|nr:hypothetical protein [Flavisolibacter sp.]
MSITNCEKDDFLRPRFRKLRAYAFDPSLSLQLETNVINNIVYKVAWEDLSPGPVGEYIEVVDYDPSSACFYRPVDLDNAFVLAQEGLEPSESNPQFHQQMVYAVAMTTIKNFELALGRKITWSQYRNARGEFSQYVQRLRIYPHALREANAYYSPQKKALLFGYFNSTPENPGLQMPGCTVYTCLSHDIIAHEITHALLDGMHRRYVEATHIDSLAFHEAFADIVALFQHFTFPEVLKDQIAKTGGDLRAQNLLGELAQEFGKAIGHYGSLRNAIGRFDPEKNIWQPHVPNPQDYLTEKEPHARGAILVATIFDAFISLYKRRIADLVRIATGGTGILPPGSLHPDLVNRMANEASKTAGHILKICIRALDYCPPLDINFGDYLRALITSDYDLVSDDNLDYRIAIIEAFQKRGIFPDNVKNMSVESLLCKVEDDSEQFESRFAKLIDFFRRFKEKISYISNRREIYELTKIFITGGDISKESGSNAAGVPHRKESIQGLHQRLNIKFLGNEDAVAFGKLTGLILDDSMVDVLGIGRSKGRNTMNMPMLEVHNLKLASRSGPRGDTVNQIIVTLTQKRGVVARRDKWGNAEIIGFFKPEAPTEGWYERTPAQGGNDGFTYTWQPYTPRDTGSLDEGNEKVLPEGWFIFRGGSTLIFDLDYSSDENEVKLQYVIKKDINDEERMRRQFDMLFNQQDFSLNATYFGAPHGNLEAEPFAIIHKVL